MWPPWYTEAFFISDLKKVWGKTYSELKHAANKKQMPSPMTTSVSGLFIVITVPQMIEKRYVNKGPTYS